MIEIIKDNPEWDDPGLDDKILKQRTTQTTGMGIITFKPDPTPTITKVIFNNPGTIVLWSDGVKTVVKCDEDDIFDHEKGLALAISKRFFNNKSNYYNVFKKWVPEQPEDMYEDVGSIVYDPQRNIEAIQKDIKTIWKYVKSNSRR